MIRAGIIGAAGYTGGELIRLLLNHNKVTLAFAQSSSRNGKPLASVHQDLMGETDMIFSDDPGMNVDVLFLCLSHHASEKFLSENTVPDRVRIIDLSQDFRLYALKQTGNRTFVYGLPELYREEISMARNVANPGCFATAIQLGLLPLVKSGFSGNIYSTGITGATGAGRGLSESTHFAWRANNIQSYKSLSHQHIQEIDCHLNGGFNGKVKVHFIPWRGDFTRGIYVSQQLQTELSVQTLYGMYESYYSQHPYTIVSKEPVHLKQVINTNKCMIHIEQHEGQTVIHSAIDNLLKGACGQAVQNMNLMLGWNETEGLKLKAGYF